VPLPSNASPKLWLALLRELDAAGGSARPREVCRALLRYFPEITEAELEARRSPVQTIWENRVHWARQWLVQKGLIDKRVRGVWQITDEGRDWLHRQWRGPEADYSAAAGRVTEERSRTG
jgi:restriction endonuclease Mrr